MRTACFFTPKFGRLCGRCLFVSEWNASQRWKIDTLSSEWPWRVKRFITCPGDKSIKTVRIGDGQSCDSVLLFWFQGRHRGLMTRLPTMGVENVWAVEVKLESSPSNHNQSGSAKMFWAAYSVFIKLLSCSSCPCRTMWNCALRTTVVLNEVITNPATILHPWCHVRRDVFRKTKRDCIVLHQWPGLRLNRLFPVRSENRSNTSQPQQIV